MKKVTVKVSEHERVMQDWDWSKNEEHPETVRATSPLRVWWNCHTCKHSWQAAIYNRVGSKKKKGSGCPACSRRTGGKTRTRLHDYPELMAEWSELNEVSPEQISPSSTRSLIWVCPDEGHLWKGAVNQRIREGLSCTVCSGDFTPLYIVHPQLYAEIQFDKFQLPQHFHSPYFIVPGSHVYVPWKCSTCDHEWEALVANRARGAQTGCPQCWRASHAEQQLEKSLLRNGAIADHTAIMEEWDWEKNVHLDPTKIPSTWTGKAWWKCAAGHSWHSQVGFRVERDWMCPQCASLKSVNEYYKSRAAVEGSLADHHPQLMEEWDWDENQHLNPYEILTGSRRHAWWICRKCDHEWKAAIANRARGAETGCPQCALEIYVSKGERNLAEYVRSLTALPVMTSVRSVIPPSELDIYLPDLQVAIEFNGDYWHSEHIISTRHGITAQQYHQSKIDRCAEQQVTLAYVWENDWNHHRSAVEEALRHLLTTGELLPVLTKLRSDIELTTTEAALANVPADDDFPDGHESERL